MPQGQGGARLKLSLEAGKLGLWELDPKTGAFDATKRARTCFGLAENASLSLGAITDALHPGDRELWQSQLQRVCEEGAALDVECRTRATDGSMRWLHLTGQMVGRRMPDARLLIAGAVLDITEQKQIASLKENAERLRWFVEQAPVAIAMFDRNMRYMAVSRLWRTDYALGRPASLAAPITSSSPEITPFWKDVHQRGLAGETLRDERDPFKHADGRVQWLSWEVRPWHDAGGAVGGIFIVSEDITPKVKAERALSESREDLNRAQAVAHTGSWRLNVRTNELSWSDETFRMFGVPPATNLTYESFLDVVHPIDRERVDRSWKAALEGAPYDIECRVIADGITKWIHARSELGLDFAGNVLGGFGTVQDITYKKHAEEALRQSEERLRAIVDTAVDAIIIIDENGLIVSINPAAERMFGYAASDIVGENVSILMTGPHRTAHDAYISAYRRTGKAKIIGIGREVEGRRKDGSAFAVDLAIAEWQVAGKRYFTGIIRDISERKRQEQKVALLLREVNHRAKNMLALVQAIASQTAVPQGSEFVERFSERLAALAASQDLLVMSGWQGVNARKLVRSQLSHFEELIDDRIKLAGPPLNLSAAGAQAIGMALHELATNAGKYGALSNSTGRIEIAWRLDRKAHSDQFTLSWVEAGGPPVFPPKQSGFGTTVIEAVPRMELDAEVTLVYAPEGLCWRLECPAERVLEIPSGFEALREASAERKL
ncbi:MAG TPA: PAS domain S-box protein [Geobacterales bacterium]|nr:PAS domain S-box protein [Geobacterales bacterium]